MMKKIVGVVGIVLAVVFVVLAVNTEIPSKYISSYSMKEYVGGDAYNFIIEAGLRGGEIAGAYATRAIYFGVAALLAVISLFCLAVPTPA